MRSILQHMSFTIIQQIHGINDPSLMKSHPGPFPLHKSCARTAMLKREWNRIGDFI